MDYCQEMNYYDYKLKSCQVCAENNFLLVFFFMISFVPFTFLFSSAIIARFIWLPYVNKVNKQFDEMVEEKKETPYSEKYCIDKEIHDNEISEAVNNGKCWINDCTPDGNVMMKYNVENEGFDYWCDKKDISYIYLETVARKYVTAFKCSSLYIDRKKDIDDQIEKEKQRKEKEEEEMKNTENSDTEDSVFAKLKPSEKIKPKNKKINAAVHGNKFKYMGKISDFKILNKPDVPEKSNKKISFSSWKTSYF